MGVQVVFCTDTSLVKKPGFYEIGKDGQIDPHKFVSADAEGDTMISLAAHAKATSRASQGDS